MSALNILYFGSIRDITGIPSEIITNTGTLNEILAELLIKYPGISGTRYQVSLNRQIIHPGDPASSLLKPASGDEIALLPPFAGG
jgi:molybdopterin converting factor small subunit